MSERWYQGGLRFECTSCGNCCTGAPGYVWVTQAEIAALAEGLSLSVDEFGRRFLRRVGRRYSLVERPNGDCVFWDRGCTVYSARPKQCRTFPFWPEVLRSRRSWEETEAECPGAGQGRLYSPGEIDAIRGGEAEASSDRD